MYWRDDPVVGVDEAELPQFSIEEWATNERKIKLATGKQIIDRCNRYLNVYGVYV